MKIKIPTVVLLLLLSLSFTGVAQVIPANTTPAPIIGDGSSGGGSTIESLPIGSIAELRAWALEQSRRIYSGVWSATSLKGSNTVTTHTRVLTNGMDIIKDMEYLNNLKFLMNIHNLQEEISLYSSIDDSEGWNLFYGQASSRAFAISDNELVANAKIVIRMNSYIPIPVNNAKWATISERDEYGNVIAYHQVTVIDYKNSLYFPVFFAGRAGEMFVEFKDGTQSFFNLQNGKKMNPQQVTSQVSVKMLGVVGIEDTNAVYIEVSERDYDEGRSTTVQLTLSQATWVAFASWLPNVDAEKAYSVRIRASGSDKTQEYKIIEPAYYVPVALDAGRYYITFRFRSGFGEDEYTRPPQNTGKG